LGPMKAKCGNCGREHVLKDSEIAQHSKVQFRCSKCGQPTVVEVKLRPDATIVMSPLPSFARTGTEGGASTLGLHDAELAMPSGVVAGLQVMDGPDKGLVRQFEKASNILGRQGADIVLKDPEVSRHHCLLEVKDSYINLKDLDSTNGTFFDGERVRAAMLQDGAEFRIGTSTIRVSFERKA
ncbi:MAG TPA: FHA domain-containing protein, partial [Candidatus Acidoferrum sp.]|nr:FHA domain-containing protein [Candidatus Acidoferrum sp.]